MIVVGTEADSYKSWQSRQVKGVNNGAYWYSKEIESIILPELDYNLCIITAGATILKPYEVPEGAVIVCHDNRTPRKSYGMLFGKKVLWVCSKHSTVDLMRSYGEKAVYVPLSIDTEYVKKFKRRRTRDIAYVGNPWAFKKSYLGSLPKHVVQLYGMGRDQLLSEIARYKRVIAEGRCLMEAQVLGAKGEVPKYDDGIEAVFVKPFDSRDAIPYWKEALLEHSKLYGNRCILKCIRPFNDLREARMRLHNEIFSVSQERADELLSNSIKIVERV